MSGNIITYENIFNMYMDKNLFITIPFVPKGSGTSCYIDIFHSYTCYPICRKSVQLERLRDNLIETQCHVCFSPVKFTS